MSKKSKLEIDELLSGFIDGELSERQRTEVKRLIRHDDELSQRLNQLKRQKQLLGALPIVPAPEGLLDDVKATLERQSILDNASVRRDESDGVRHLIFRKFLTAAAMLSLVGALVWVVLNVVMPLDSDGDKPFFVKPTLPAIFAPKPEVRDVPGDGHLAVAQLPPFESHLDLMSDQAITLNNFIEKTVYYNGLRDSTIPRRSDNSTTYEISGPTVKVLALISDLQPIWDRCSRTSFSVESSDDAGSGLVVEDITAEQLLAIFKEEKNDTRLAMTKNYASFNSESRNMPDFSPASEDSSSNIAMPIPILTAPPATEDDTTESESGQQVKFTITVVAM